MPMKSKSLRSSMFLLYITTIIIPFLVISALYSYYYSVQILDNNKTNVSNTLESVSTGIGIYVAELNSISNVPYYISDVMDTMQDINSGKHQDIATSTEFLKNSKEFRLVFLKYIYNATQNISNVSFIPTSNSLNLIYVMSRNANQTKIMTDSEYKNTDWYTYLQNNERASVFFPLFEDGKDTTSDARTLTGFFYAKIIRDVDTKKNIGVIKIEIPAKNILQLVGHVQLSTAASILITSEDGEIIYMKTGDSNLKEMKNSSEFSDLSRMRYQIIKQPIDNTSLQLIYLSSNREILYYQIYTYFIVFLFTLAAVFLSFFIYRFKTNKIAKSVSSIKDTFKKIETGDLSIKCNVSSQQEFIEISHALNHMTEKLNEYITNEYKANLSRQEAEYRALQAQINPHFLYNTLNGFIALNRMGEKRLLEKSIIQLTHLFQYTCSSNTLTSIDAELSFIHQYLELQSLKYDERLFFSIYIEPGTENILIPKLLLQPLIENSIIHGLEPSDKRMHIWIETAILDCMQLGNFVFIHIRDDGCGFDMVKLEALRHIGLKNIENRLKYHNPNNIFQIRSEAGKGTECIILLSII